MDSGSLHPNLPASDPVFPAPHALGRSGATAALPAASALRRVGWRQGYRFALLASDTAVVLAAVLLAQAARFGPPMTSASDQATAHAVFGAGLCLLWLAALGANRSRDLRHIGVGTVEFERVAGATFATFGIVAVVALLLDLEIARGHLLVAFPAGLLLLIAERYAWRVWLRARRREGSCLTGAYVVGSHADATRVVQQLRKRHDAGYEPVGVAFTDGRGGGRALGVDDPLPAIDFASLPWATRQDPKVRAVIVAGDLPGGREQLQTLGWQLENSRIELILVSALTDVAGPRIHMRPVEGLPMLHVDLPQYAGMNHTVKRGLDLMLAGAGVIVLAPVLAVVALAVLLDSPGPVLFRQQRVGANGEPFLMLKFRSMVVDAEARYAELVQLNEGAGLLFKVRHDPRVTRVGRMLRRTSLDELPQLFNVLNGTMSLIGPRPPLPREVAAYEGRVNRRLLIKPGITGLWQVSGRSNLSWEESVKLDLYYVENWSITTDAIILLKTVRAVLRRDGAY